jgi:multidrug efflux system membrane fusion protein
VWLVLPDNSVTVRTVTVGVTEGGETEIKSGIEAGDVLVTNGVDRLQEKSKVNPRVAGEAPKGGDDKSGGSKKGGRGKKQ